MDHYYIYCLHNDDLPEYYVGHTMNWGKRWRLHKTDSKNKNSKVYKYINSNGGINNFKMEVLYETYCSLEEAIKLERYYMELLEATLNSEVPGRTRKERMVWYNPIYYQKNKETIAEKNKKYHQENKEKNKHRYQENKEQISEQHKEKFTCICGSTLRTGDKQRHFKTKKHINFISSIL
tara:strand:+ start:348 stop:884 length:537 start_codon:yes stop_codon:yes gene_type:complete